MMTFAQTYHLRTNKGMTNANTAQPENTNKRNDRQQDMRSTMPLCAYENIRRNVKTTVRE